MPQQKQFPQGPGSNLGETALVLSASFFFRRKHSLTLISTQLQFPAESVQKEKASPANGCGLTLLYLATLPHPSYHSGSLRHHSIETSPLLAPGIRVNFVHELSPSVLVLWNEPYCSTWMHTSQCLFLTQENPIFLLHVSFHLHETSFPWSWLVCPWQSWTCEFTVKVEAAEPQPDSCPPAPSPF